MAGDASAYAALGLTPGADPAAIDRAYKELIKQYHPDREGGDARRAAEINRAYRELRCSRDVDDELIVQEREPVDASPAGFRWARASALIGVAILLLVLFNKPASQAVKQLRGTTSSTRQIGEVAPRAIGSEIMNQPLDLASVDGGVRDAVQIARSRDEMALASASRDCHHQLRLKPNLAQLDRCAAFDDTVVQLQNRDPLRDRGPFSELAVTGRLRSAATLFSDDYLAIDSRLDRIRSRVERGLARPLQAPARAAQAD